MRTYHGHEGWPKHAIECASMCRWKCRAITGGQKELAGGQKELADLLAVEISPKGGVRGLMMEVTTTIPV